MKRKIFIFTAVMMCMLLLSDQVLLATSSGELNQKVEDAKENVAKDKEELSELNEEIEALEGEQEGIQAEIDEISLAVVDLMAGIELLEEDIKEKEEEIEVAKTDLETAILTEETQYENTKERLQVMYESGNTSYLEMLIESNSIQQLLTRMEYVEQVYEYDNRMLAEYKEAKETVETLKIELEGQEAELIGAKDECEAEKIELEGVLSQLKAASAEYESKISKAQKQAGEYALKIKKQNEEIRKLEKAREEAKRREEGNTEEENTGNKQHSGSAYELNPSVITDSNGSEAGKQVALYAIRFLGNPYKAGGTSLTNGTDCSGFTMSVYQNFGISIPRTSYSQRSCGVEVAYENAQPGDIVCYSGHVGLYVGQGLIVHASSAKTGIKISKATYRTILSVRRVV